MNESIANVLSKVFFYSIFITPLFGYWTIRKSRLGFIGKIISGFVITIVLEVAFFALAVLFLLMSGNVPGS
jgi:hypothetical protein